MRVNVLSVPELLVLALVFLVSIVPLFLFWRIFGKAGFSGPLALMLLIPGVGLLAACVTLAVVEWPALSSRS